MKPGHRTRDDAVELSAYLRALRRGLIPVVLCAVVGAVVGSFWTLRTPRVYSSTSAVLVADAPLYLSRKGEDGAKFFTIDTEAARLISGPVLAATRRATGEVNVRSHLHLSAVPTTKVLKVTYQSTSKQAAERGAAAMTSTYLRLRREEFEARRDSRVELIGQQVATLNARLDETVITGQPTAAKVTEQRASRLAIAQQIAARQAESRQVRTTSAYPGQVLQIGGTTSARRVNPLVPPVNGLLIGGLVGLLLAAARSSRVGRATDIVPLIPGRSVITVPRRWVGRAGTRTWDPIATGVLELGSGTVMVAPPHGEATETERAAAEQLSAVLRSYGREAQVVDHTALPSEVIPALDGRRRAITVVVTSGALTDEPGSVLAARTGHVVLVVTPDTPQRELVDAVHRVAEVGATMHGVVLLTRFALSGGRLRLALPRRST